MTTRPLAKPDARAPAGRRRKPFAAIRKGLIEHVVSGRLRGAAFAIYVWLHLKADHIRGVTRTNASQLALELGFHPVTVRRALSHLRARGYVRYAPAAASRSLYEITIEKYHANFEDAGSAQPPAGLLGALSCGLHVEAGTAREPGANRSRKKKEESSTTTTTLRVRRADSVLAETDSSERGAAPSKIETASPSPTLAEATAQAPAILRETIELFGLKTGRAHLSAEEVAALAELEQTHTPAVIQRAISAAVDRFRRTGRPLGDLTIHYVHEALRHFTTRRVPHRPAAGAAEAVPAGKYPAGLTPLHLSAEGYGRDPLTEGAEARATRAPV